MSNIDRTGKIQKFSGHIYYVSANYGDDANNGLNPETELQTIGAAIGKLVQGDAIVIGAGNYTETGLNLNVNNCEMWFEIGAQISPSSGVCLTISGSFCRVTCREGALKINNDDAATTGLLVTGNFCYLDEIRVACVSTGAIGFDLQGDGIDARRCRCSSPAVAAFKIQGDTIKVEHCCTGGEVANNSIGFWITNSCDKARVDNCGSQGHATASLQIDEGCTNVVVRDGTAGGGDGHFIDNGTLTFLDLKEKDSRQLHEHVYPNSNGMGLAGNPVTINNIITDETGSESSQHYYGDPKIIVPVNTITVDWFLKGVNVYATTTNDVQRFFGYRVEYDNSAARNGGNNWDAGETVLTFDDATNFQTNDLIWISSPNYKPNGEIVEIINIVGNVVTVARQTESSGRTGLHFDHTTNDSGNEVAYLCWRNKNEYHSSDWDYSAGSTKDYARQNFHKERRMHALDGFIVRMINSTDDADSEVDITIIWSD